MSTTPASSSIPALARVAVVRLFRDRSNLFFVFIFPILLILLIGVSFGGSFQPRLAYALPDGADTDPAVVSLLDDLAAQDLTLDRYDGRDAALAAASRGRANAALVLDAADVEVLAGRAAGPADLTYAAAPGGTSRALQTVVAGVIEDRRIVADAAEVLDGLGIEVDRGALAGLATAVRTTPTIEQRGENELATTFAGLGTYDLGASSQVLLFVFVTSLSAAVALVQSRQLGVARRLLATATPLRHVIAGEALGRFAVAMLQAGYIVIGSVLLFGVNWGDPLATAAILLTFGAASTGAAILLGSLVDNEAQAGGIAPAVGLGLSALGGCMVPLDVFPDTVRSVAHVTPHAWANDAFADVVRRGGGVADILPELAVLTAFAAVLLGLATLAQRRALVRA